MPDGQKLAFVRMCDDFNSLRKPVVFIIAEHNVDNPDSDIDAAACHVRVFYFRGRSATFEYCGHEVTASRIPDKATGKHFCRAGRFDDGESWIAGRTLEAFERNFITIADLADDQPAGATNTAAERQGD